MPTAFKPTAPFFTVEFFESGNFDAYSVIKYTPSEKEHPKCPGLYAIGKPTIKWTRMQGSCSMMDVWWWTYQHTKDYAGIQAALEGWYAHSRGMGLGAPYLYLASMMGPAMKMALKNGLTDLGWKGQEISSGAYSSTKLGLMTLDLKKKDVQLTGLAGNCGGAAAFARLWVPDIVPAFIFKYLDVKIDATIKSSHQIQHWGHAPFNGHWAGEVKT